jgi:hypothetical protein
MTTMEGLDTIPILCKHYPKALETNNKDENDYLTTKGIPQEQQKQQKH